MHSKRILGTLAASCLAALAPAQRLAPPSPPTLHALRVAEGTALQVDSGPVFHTTTAEVLDPRVVQVPGGRGLVALWSERREHRISAHYAVDPEGAGFRRVRETEYLLQLKHGVFDPLLGEPALQHPELSAGGALHVVQFECPPLAPFLEALENLGARVHHYLPQHARIVHVDPVRVEAIRALPYVRWVGPYRAEYRLEPYLVDHLALAEPGPTVRCYVQVLERGPLMKGEVAQRIADLGGTIEAAIPQGYRLEATLTPQQLVAVAHFDEVLWIDRWAPPEVDLDLVRGAGGAVALESLTGFSGQGVRGEVMDGNVRVSHVAFQAQPILSHGPHLGDSDHGTKTTGCVFGDGTGLAQSRGVLPSGQPIFADFDALTNRYLHTQQLLEEPYRAVFQSNSWGTGLTTQYTSSAMELDDILFDADLLIVQSQSNQGNQLSRPQAWAKNVVSVGAVDHQNTASTADDAWHGTASIGPAADGRVKPDLCFWYDSILTTDNEHDADFTGTFGGTSAATPCVAGYLGLVQQMWSEGTFGPQPAGGDVFERRAKATTARALLINTARQYPFSGTYHDLTRTHQGWGLPDVQRLHELRDALFVVNEEHVLGSFESRAYDLTVEPDQAALRATLVYLDLPGTTSASLHRINDLSLRVLAPDGKVYWGNQGLLAGNWSVPGGSSNTVDVVENVFVAYPTPGTWRVEVHADELNGDGHVETPALDADFALVVSGVVEPEPCAPPTTYCSTEPTSQGSLPAIGYQGQPGVGANDFRVLLSGGVPNQSAVLFSGTAAAATPLFGGTLCVQPPLVRGPLLQLDAAGAGVWPLDLSQHSPGTTEYFQVWFRDPAHPSGFGVGLSDGLEVTYCE